MCDKRKNYCCPLDNLLEVLGCQPQNPCQEEQLSPTDEPTILSIYGGIIFFIFIFILFAIYFNSPASNLRLSTEQSEPAFRLSDAYFGHGQRKRPGGGGALEWQDFLNSPVIFFPKFIYMTKNTPFFPILHVFAPLNDVRVYSAWS